MSLLGPSTNFMQKLTSLRCFVLASTKVHMFNTGPAAATNILSNSWVQYDPRNNAHRNLRHTDYFRITKREGPKYVLHLHLKPYAKEIKV